MVRTTWRSGLAVAALLVVGAAGCGAGGGSSEKSAVDGAGRDAAVAAAGLPEELKGPEVGQQAEDRQVIYAGTVRIRVDDAEAASDRGRAIAAEAGGYLARQEADLEGDREVVLTLRVPAGEFDDVVAALAELGDVETRDVSSEDVTDQVVDLEGRLENARTSADRLRELLAEAQDIATITTLEDKLTERETEVEALSGQMEVLADRAALSSIDVTFTEQAQQTVSDDLPGPLDALRSGAITLVNVLLVLLAVVAFLLPFAPFVALGWWLRRRWRRRHPKAPPAAVGPWGSPSATWPSAPVAPDLPPPPTDPAPDPSPEHP